MRERESSTRSQRRRLLVFTTIMWSAFSLWDLEFVAPEHLWMATLLRHGIGTSGCLLAMGMTLLAPRGHLRWAAARELMVPACILGAMVAFGAFIRPEGDVAVLDGLSVLVLASHAFPHAQARLLSPLTLAVVVAYVVVSATVGMPPKEVLNNAIFLGAAELLALMVGRQLERLRRTSWAQQRSLDAERRKSDGLLLNVLPGPVAERLKSGESPIADRVDAVTVLFADVVGFTPLSQRLEPEALVSMLDGLFRRFDAIAARHALEKIKTIGDAYMAVAGLPAEHTDHAARAAEAAIEMRDAVAQFPAPEGATLSVRIGLHTGPVVAGVIGAHKFSYDVWGDTVNTASRMESHGVPGGIHVTREVVTALDGRFETTPRGEIDLKGKGRLSTWLLVGRGARAQGGSLAT